MPAHPKPLERHMATATNGKTLGGRDLDVIDVSNLPVQKAPPAPAGLAERGSAEWSKIWQAGRWLWPDQDYHAVERVARAYDELAAFRAEIEVMGLTVEGYNGQTVANPLIAEVRRAEDSIRKDLSLLGFTPTDRARLKLTELKGATELQRLVNGGSGDPARDVHQYEEGEW